MAKGLAKQAFSELPFKVGDKAVYPAHGVGEVKSIESKEIMGAKQTFYVLQILDSGMKIMVPTANVNAVGLREVISDQEVDDVYEILKQRDVHIDNQTWNRRYREYMDKIKTGSVYEIAEVLRDLSLLKFKKELSFGERKMLDTAKSLLIKELAICEAREEDEIEEEINEIFKSA
ncbi:CarD family transcriptional regulator [Deltaproteobacteria bacterium PRO3]|nr:CarD family transcriptional regulator [Deltaproteobacteria bacterium PRO3]